MSLRRKVKVMIFGIALTTLCAFGGVGCGKTDSSKDDGNRSPQVTVEYYFEALESDEYIQDESKTVVQDAKLDSVVNSNTFIKKYNGFTHDKNNSNAISSVTITPKGQNTLKLYYSRNVYTVAFNDVGSKLELEYKYGSLISSPPKITDTEKLKFQGWDYNGDFVNFQDVTVTENMDLTAIYSAKETQILYDFENATHFSKSGYKTAERSQNYAHSGQYSYKLTPGSADNYLTVPISDSYSFNAVQYYSFYVYLDSHSFKDLEGNAIEAPELIGYSAYSIKRAFVFDASLDKPEELFDTQMTLSAVKYDEWLKVTTVGTRASNGKIRLRTSNVKAVWQNIMEWTATDFTYDIYIDDIVIENDLTSVEVKEAIAVVNEIETIKKTLPTSSRYEKYLQDAYALYIGLSDKQKALVHNRQEFLTIYEDYFQN